MQWPDDQRRVREPPRPRPAPRAAGEGRCRGPPCQKHHDFGTSVVPPFAPRRRVCPSPGRPGRRVGRRLMLIFPDRQRLPPRGPSAPTAVGAGTLHPADAGSRPGPAPDSAVFDPRGRGPTPSRHMPESPRFFPGLVVTARARHPIPSRTRPLSAVAPMVLRLKTWESRSPPNLERNDRTSRARSRCRRDPKGTGNRRGMEQPGSSSGS